MKNILTIQEAIKLSKDLKKQGKKIVLVGGVFDILHIGHITFLEKAKKEGDILIVLLESDEKVKKNKGQNRPINTVDDRAKLLCALKSVDFVVKPGLMEGNNEYDEIVKKINPDILVSAYGDKEIEHKKRQAKKFGIELKIVMKVLKDKSTTNLVKLLGYE